MTTDGIGAGVQESYYESFNTASITAAIAVGQLMELDSSGNAILCSAAVTVKFIGVAAISVAATTAASAKLVSVQTSGIVRVYCLRDNAGTYQTAIVPGERLMVGEDNAASYTGQCLVHATTGAAGAADDFNTHMRKPVAIALEAVGTAAATPLVKKVLLTI